MQNRCRIVMRRSREIRDPLDEANDAAVLLLVKFLQNRLSPGELNTVSQTLDVICDVAYERGRRAGACERTAPLVFTDGAPEGD